MRVLIKPCKNAYLYIWSHDYDSFVTLHYLTTYNMSLQQAQAEGLCLLYPDNLGLHQTLSYETVVNMLHRAVRLSQQMPYSWGYIYKPASSVLDLSFFFLLTFYLLSFS